MDNHPNFRRALLTVVSEIFNWKFSNIDLGRSREVVSSFCSMHRSIKWRISLVNFVKRHCFLGALINPVVLYLIIKYARFWRLIEKLSWSSRILRIWKFRNPSRVSELGHSTSNHLISKKLPARPSQIFLKLLESNSLVTIKGHAKY